MIFFGIRPIDGICLVASDRVQGVLSVLDDEIGRSLAPRSQSFERELRRRVDYNRSDWSIDADELVARVREFAGRGGMVASYYTDPDLYGDFKRKGDLDRLVTPPLEVCNLLGKKLLVKEMIQRELQIPVIPTLDPQNLGGHGLVVLRPAHSDGGKGIKLWDLSTGAPPPRCAYIEPFLEGPSVNVHVAVSERRVLVFPPSVQLIGDPCCSPGRFDYCGGDFSAARGLEGAGIRPAVGMAYRVGEWLAARGYRGVAGVDMLLHRGKPYFVEVNPRLQSSTFALSLGLSWRGLPTLEQLHVSALVHGVVPDIPVDDLFEVTPPSHVAVTFPGPEATVLSAPRPGWYEADLTFRGEVSVQDLLSAPFSDSTWLSGTPVPGVVMEPGTLLFRVVTMENIIDLRSGRLKKNWVTMVQEVVRRMQVV